jgi:hypothetical protein
MEALEPLAFGTKLDAADNLYGVICDVVQGKGFDEVSLRTLKRVHQQLLEARAAVKTQ